MMDLGRAILWACLACGVAGFVLAAVCFTVYLVLR